MRADGHVHFDSGWGKNLLLDQFFLDLKTTSIATIGSVGITMANGSIMGGTGNTNPTRKDSTPTTLSQSGTTVTASSGFFSAADVGQLLVFGASGSGTNACYITAFTSTTQVTVNISQTVGAVVGTVWYVSSSWALSGTTLSLPTIVTGTGNCGTTWSGNQVTQLMTFQSGVQASPITIQQLAYRDHSVQNFASFTIPGAGDTIPANFFYVVSWSITMTVTPGSPTAVSNIGSGINTAGNAMIEAQNAFSSISTSGSSSAANPNLDGNVSTNAAYGTAMMTASTYTQNAVVGTAPAATQAYATTWVNTVVWTASTGTSQSTAGQVVGVFTYSLNTTGTGAIIKGIGIGNSSGTAMDFDILLTSSYSSPGSGTFTFVMVFTVTITRTITN